MLKKFEILKDLEISKNVESLSRHEMIKQYHIPTSAW